MLVRRVGFDSDERVALQKRETADLLPIISFMELLNGSAMNGRLKTRESCQVHFHDVCIFPCILGRVHFIEAFQMWSAKYC